MAKIDLGSIAGPGVPEGGTAGQVLIKDGIDDYSTKWTDLNTFQEIVLGTNWEGDSENGYTQTVPVIGITENDSPIIDVKKTGSTLAEKTAQKTEWAKLLQATTSNNSITFLASEPTIIQLTLIINWVSSSDNFILPSLTGTATPSDVLNGKTFYSTDINTKLTGTLVQEIAVFDNYLYNYASGNAGDGEKSASYTFNKSVPHALVFFSQKGSGETVTNVGGSMSDRQLFLMGSATGGAGVGWNNFAGGSVWYIYNADSGDNINIGNKKWGPCTLQVKEISGPIKN